jgi:hypothetical protein
MQPGLLGHAVPMYCHILFGFCKLLFLVVITLYNTSCMLQSVLCPDAVRCASHAPRLAMANSACSCSCLRVPLSLRVGSLNKFVSFSSSSSLPVYACGLLEPLLGPPIRTLICFFPLRSEDCTKVRSRSKQGHLGFVQTERRRVTASPFHLRGPGTAHRQEAQNVGCTNAWTEQHRAWSCPRSEEHIAN